MRLRNPLLGMLAVLATACADQSVLVPDVGATSQRPRGNVIGSPEGAAAVYALDGDVDEATNSALNGTIVGLLYPTEDRFNQPGKALGFDGDSSWAVLPAGPTDEAEALTINVWLRRAPGTDLNRCGRTDLAAPFTCQHNIFSKSTSDGSAIMRAQFLGVPVNSFYLLTGYDQYAFSPPLAASLGSWQMYTFVWSGSLQAIYFNGVKVQETATTQQNSGLGELFLGHNGHPTLGSRERFEGAMDDLAVYRRALSADEVCSLYLPIRGTRRVLAQGTLIRNGITYPRAALTYDQTMDESDAGSNPGIELWSDSTLTRRLERSNDNNGQWDYQIQGAYFLNGQAVVFGTRTGSHGPQPREWRASGGYFLSQFSTFTIPESYNRCGA